MRVFPGPSLPEPGACLQLAGTGGTEWKYPYINTYARGWSGDINNIDLGSLESWIGLDNPDLVDMGASRRGRRWGSWAVRA